jgi:hypothetical protein
MEVHAHSHTARKKWTHYFWEFLMLFLAVFCGFLAENIREHKVERIREKQYMNSLLSDLRTDTFLINRCKAQITYIIDGHDSLESTLERITGGAALLKKLYYENTLFTGADFFVNWTEGTLQELKGSGSVRLVSKEVIKEDIKKYETIKQWCNDQHKFSYESIQRTYYFANDIFDINCYKKYNDFLQQDWLIRLYEPFENVKKYISDNPQLLTNDKIVLKKYLRLVNNEKNSIIIYRTYLESAKEAVLKLINTITTEYGFK